MKSLRPKALLIALFVGALSIGCTTAPKLASQPLRRPATEGPGGTSGGNETGLDASAVVSEVLASTCLTSRAPGNLKILVSSIATTTAADRADVAILINDRDWSLLFDRRLKLALICHELSVLTGQEKEESFDQSVLFIKRQGLSILEVQSALTPQPEIFKITSARESSDATAWQIDFSDARAVRLRLIRMNAKKAAYAYVIFDASGQNRAPQKIGDEEFFGLKRALSAASEKSPVLVNFDPSSGKILRFSGYENAR